MLVFYPYIIYQFTRFFHHEQYYSLKLSDTANNVIYVLSPVIVLSVFLMVSSMIFGLFSSTFLSMLKLAGIISGIGIFTDIFIFSLLKFAK